MLEKEFDETIDLTRRCMQILGVWPNSDKYTSSLIRFSISLFFMLFFIVIPQTTNLYFVRNNLSADIDILTYANLVVFVGCCDLCNGWFNRQGKSNWLVFNVHTE